MSRTIQPGSGAVSIRTDMPSPLRLMRMERTILVAFGSDAMGAYFNPPRAELWATFSPKNTGLTTAQITYLGAKARYG